jgi:uracil phosphoribosyltransferase
MSANLFVVDHPLIKRDLTILRRKETPVSEFRAAMNRIAIILAYHALDRLPLSQVPIQTPIQSATGSVAATEVVVVPILRAGLSLMDALITFIPDARVGHLGMYRDEKTFEPVDYYSKIPNGVENAYVLVIDPMLATGGSACDAIAFLKKKGAKNIRFICLIAAPEGIEKVSALFPDVSIVAAAVDEKLNEHRFIVPGLGDAGDRYFGTG